MSEQHPNAEATQPTAPGNPWRTATVIVALTGAGLAAITGLAGFGIGLGVATTLDNDRGHHQMTAGPQFNRPGFTQREFGAPEFDIRPDFDNRHHGDRRDGRSDRGR